MCFSLVGLPLEGKLSLCDWWEIKKHVTLEPCDRVYIKRFYHCALLRSRMTISEIKRGGILPPPINYLSFSSLWVLNSNQNVIASFVQREGDHLWWWRDCYISSFRWILNSNQKVEPLPSSLETPKREPWRRRMLFTMDRPSPVPKTARLCTFIASICRGRCQRSWRRESSFN